MDAQAAGVARISADDDALTEFRQDLPAGAARAKRGTGRDDRNRLELAMPFADGFADGNTLGAIGQSVTGVLDVDARVNLAAFCEQRGADTKPGVGRMGVSLGDLGGGNQFTELERGGFHSAPMNSLSSRASFPCAARPTSRTSSCESFLLEIPAARLVMQETPTTSMLW